MAGARAGISSGAQTITKIAAGEQGRYSATAFLNRKMSDGLSWWTRQGYGLGLLKRAQAGPASAPPQAAPEGASIGERRRFVECRSVCSADCSKRKYARFKCGHSAEFSG